MTIRILKYILYSRFFFVFAALLAPFFVKLDTGFIGRQVDTAAPYIAWVWANLDGRHYIEIASQGYQRFNFAYFPLYPLLIRIVHEVTTAPYLYSAIWVSLIFFLGAIYMVYKIILIDHSNRLAILSIFFLCFFPLSFFYQAVYPDSLFLFLTTTSFYFARSGKWGLAGIFGGLSLLTRIAGVALIPALIVEWLLQKTKVKREILLAVLLTASGLLVYMGYLQVFYGDAFLFQKSLSAWNQETWVIPFQVVWRYFKIFWFVDKTTLVFWVAVLEFVSFFAYLGLSYFVYKKVRASYGILMFVLLLLVSFTGTFAGTPRFILHLFPAFIGIAKIADERRELAPLLALTFLVLGLILAGLFTRGYFVA